MSARPLETLSAVAMMAECDRLRAAPPFMKNSTCSALAGR